MDFREPVVAANRCPALDRMAFRVALPKHLPYDALGIAGVPAVIKGSVSEIIFNNLSYR
jgi:hypothetical protein